MDKKKYKQLEFYDIIEVEEDIYLILRVKGQKFIKPININDNQLSIIRSIRGKKKKRNDIFKLAKNNSLIKKIAYGLLVTEHFLQFYSKENKKLLQMNSIDGIILAFDNNIPLYYDNNIEMYFGIEDFFKNIFGDYEDLIDNQNIM